MLKTNSVITRREPVNDGYDTAVIVGPNPVSAGGASPWPSSGGHTVIVRPTEFGENAVMPLDYIAANYDVTAPVVETPYPLQQPPVYADQPSPEDVFAEEARNAPVVVKPGPVALTPEEIAAKRIEAKTPVAKPKGGRR